MFRNLHQFFKQKLGPAKEIKFLAEKAQVFITQPRGNTSLHSILHDGSLEEIHYYLRSHTTEALKVMSVTPNDYDALPIDYLSVNASINTQDKRRLKNILKTYMSSHDLKPIHEKIRYEDILKYNKPSPNLEFAHEVMTHARELIKESNTHPDIYLSTPEQQTILAKKIEAMRNNYSKYYTLPVRDFLSMVKDAVIESGNVGNCGEANYLTAHFATTLSNKMAVTSYVIEKGNHIVTSIAAKTNDPHKEDPLIIDSWAGTILSASNVHHLSCCYGYPFDDKRLIVISPLNPNVHTLAAKLSVNGSVDLSKCKQTPGFFKPIKIIGPAIETNKENNTQTFSMK